MQQPITRQDAQRRLEAFLPRMAEYGRIRNQVVPGHRNVSGLSGALRFRTLLEEEVIQQTLATHSFQAAEKWLQEVCWRQYWKGWLERRPKVWTQWRSRVRSLLRELPEQTLARADAVMAGKSGVDCMDRIARELVETGYLHNHARMWWASFWIHVERLPWELGADFFFRHLVDADPASNTLSWRWVAGLQTVGKTYLVRISNIEKHAPCYLEGANEGAQRLADSAVTAHVVTDTLDTNARPLADYPTVLQQSPGRTGLWLHPDDLTPEIGPLSLLKPVAIAACICEPVYRETFGLSPRRIDALETVLQDGLNRAQRHYGIEYEAIRTGDSVTALVEWARRNRLNMVVGFAPMVGPTGDLLARLERELGSAGIGWKWVRRSSDVTAFGLASAGFFPFWQKMSRLLTGKAE